MNRLRKLFFGLNITYKTIIIGSIIIGFFAAVFLIIPITIHSSFGNIGTYLEFWLFSALIIICNSKKPLEAGLKTFVYFLISQPLIYLFQVPFSFLGWGLFKFYPQWFVITLFTLPGGFIAYYIKKDNIFSALMVAVAVLFFGVSTVEFGYLCIKSFPRNLITTLFCLANAILLIPTLLSNKKSRIVAFITSFLPFIAYVYLAWFF